MRFLHISDLHIGKSMCEVPLVEDDQPYWIDRFLEKVRELKPDAVVIAGDVYDRGNPSSEAVTLFDSMLNRLCEAGVCVLVVAGNHDSGAKLAFANNMLQKSRVYIEGVPSKTIKRVTLSDEFGEVDFYLVPYVFPAEVERLLGRDDLGRDYDRAFKALLDAQDIDLTRRNVIVAHQTVLCGGSAPALGGSESLVAGIGGIDCGAFERFEYAALGHIHRAQKMGRDNIRYAGSPLCCHFSEAPKPLSVGEEQAAQAPDAPAHKGAVLVELREKGSEPEIRFVPIAPLHNVRTVRGTVAEICEALGSGPARGEYLRAEVTEELTDPKAADTLRGVAEACGSRLLEIASLAAFEAAENVHTGGELEQMSLSKLFEEFSQSSGRELDDNDKRVIELLEELVTRADTDTEAGVDKLSDELADRLIAAARNEEVGS